MSDENRPTGRSPQEHDSTGWVILGAVLIVVGALLGARALGILPWPFTQLWGLAVEARYGIGVLLLGVLLIVWAQSGRQFTMPERGAKLYRSREGKWVAGVLGGLADYFRIDATLLRLAFIALVASFDMGALFVAYIIMAIVVPQEPEAPAGGVSAAPAPPVAPVPAVAPAPAPAAPAPPAPDNAAPPADEAPAAGPPAGVTQA